MTPETKAKLLDWIIANHNSSPIGKGHFPTPTMRDVDMMIQIDRGFVTQGLKSIAEAVA